MRNINEAFLIGITVMFAIVGAFIILTHNGNITLNNSYEKQWNECKSDFKNLNTKYDDLSKDRQVVCEVPPTSPYSFMSFVFGGIAGMLITSYFLLVGKDWLIEKLQEKGVIKR